ncbi:MAG: ATP-dependent DNA helicase RecG [Bacteroidia bacterium]
MSSFLNTELQFIKGIGEARSTVLQKELAAFTVADLLQYYPFRYIDRSVFHKIKDIDSEQQFYQIRGVINHIDVVGFKKNSRLVARFFDGQKSVELVWFRGVQWVKKSLTLNEEVVLFGKPTFYKGKLNFAHPEIEAYDPNKLKPFEAVYSVTELMRNRRLESKALRKIMDNILRHEKWNIPEFFSEQLRKENLLIPRPQAFKSIHQPKNQKEADLAVYRFKFEELFMLQFPFIRQKLQRKREAYGLLFESLLPKLRDFLEHHLPFKLTGAQQRVLKEIKSDLCSGQQMNRLLQGDVGSGKTIVAYLSALMAIDNGCQACLMAPTEILATQHYLGLKEWAALSGIRVALLTGSTPNSERKELHRLLRLGEIHILIGTHALIEDVVSFHKLGLVIIDEQHRFGVAQRARLQEKADHPPHVLVMTATPIPRTLAMSLYGDLDYSVIDELPAGRQEIKTAHRFGFAREKVWAFIKEEIAKGRQAYIVYPLIEESEVLNYRDLNSGYDDLLKYFPRPDYQIAMLHGQMKSEDKEAVMQAFKEGKHEILVSTTVIEVGVDVPNATVMLIESAEKFGLSQLHQLRGRVGRGGEQSYCILMSSKKISENAETRLKAMVSTNSGFDLSEIDMQLRGFGDIAGTRQSGLDQLKLSSLSNDQQIAMQARNALVQILKADPDLVNSENQALKNHIQSRSAYREWTKIA